jgi:sugar-specific transcriptional regulator TrmB
MNIRPILHKIGMTEKEADIYLACLEHGPDTISNIARQAGYKRPTVYNIMEQLLRDGFVVLIRRNRRTLYDAERPRKLLTGIRARERELEQLMPDLEDLRNAKKEIPQVEVYESGEAVKLLYDEIYDSFNTKNEICFLTSVGDMMKNIPDALDAYVAKVTAGKGYKVRELIFNDEQGRHYVKQLKQRGVSHDVRLLSDEFPFYNDLVIYGTKVAIFSYKNRFIATKFDNREIATTLKTLFEWAWKNGRE